MKRIIPKFDRKLTAETIKDLERFAKLDKKAFEASFVSVDKQGHNSMYYRDKQFAILSKYINEDSKQDHFKEAMLNRSVDFNMTNIAMEAMKRMSNHEDKRRKR